MGLEVRYGSGGLMMGVARPGMRGEAMPPYTDGATDVRKLLWMSDDNGCLYVRILVAGLGERNRWLEIASD